MKNDKCIEKYECVKINQLDAENFIGDLLAKAYENKIIDEIFLQKIYTERMKTLQQMLIYYTKNESSSVIQEDAEKVLKSIDYTVSIYLKRCNDVEEIIYKLNNESFDEMLSAGNKIIKMNVKYCKELLDEIQKNKLQAKNYSYHDTIDRGFAEFFVMYDDFFEAYVAPCSVDYQLSIDVDNYAGVEYVKRYFESLSMENQFCNNFNIDDINNLLISYSKDCELLLLNIFDMVLTNCLGLTLCNSDIRKINISSFESEIIYNKLKDLSLNELEAVLIKCAEKCIDELLISDEKLRFYIKRAVIKLSPSIYDSVKINILNKVFIEFNENEEEKIIEFIDKDKISNTKFRKITEKIRTANSLQVKFNIINENIKSLADLNDMLDSECLFDDEYEKFFKTLSNMKIILLAKYIDDYGKHGDWVEEFKQFLSSFSENERKCMEEIKNRIVLS